MTEGRLIRVTKCGTKPPTSVAYIVAEADKAKAMEIILSSKSGPGDDVLDLGRVSEALLNAMALPSGEFVPISGAPEIDPKK
jgi:hypothetical protein